METCENISVVNSYSGYDLNLCLNCCKHKKIGCLEKSCDPFSSKQVQEKVGMMILEREIGKHRMQTENKKLKHSKIK